MKYLFWGSLIMLLGLAYTPANYALETGLSDKINHAAAFAVLSTIACRAYGRKIISITAGLMLYGVIIEIGQLLVPGRSCSMLDLMADLSGIFAGIILDTCIDFFKKRLSEV